MARGTINRVILIGRLGDEPKARYTPGGDAVVNFNIATNEAWKDKDGNPQVRTDWHRIVAWRQLAEFCIKYLKKGSRVYVEGRLRTRSWENKEGNTNYVTEIVINHLQMLDNKPVSENVAAEHAGITPEADVTENKDVEDVPF
jgi:single-strand DNA-binding protein